MDSDFYFKKVLKELRPLFKWSGFMASSQNFSCDSLQCWAVINFQKSRWSNFGEKTFYINVAITPKRLLAFDGEPTDKAPAYYACIWRARAEDLGPDRAIKQWTVRDDATSQSTFEYLHRLLGNFVIPAVKGMMSEATLLERGKRLSPFPYLDLKARAVLLAADGKLPKLRIVIQKLYEEFGDLGQGNGVKDHMERLRSTFPDVMRKV
jgi:Domain of unknown function (DUF4304)